jgi:flagellar biosynthesis/type III secretory pathway chaperone
VDPTVCREHFEKLLIEEANALARLEALLDREHGFLVANNVDELERAGEARQACVGELIHVEEERRSLCRMMNVPTDVSGLERVLKWCDPSGSLKERLAECAASATRCRAANDRNGALVSARMKKVEGMLDVLTGRPSQAKVYGKQGTFENSARAGRVQVSV